MQKYNGPSGPAVDAKANNCIDCAICRKETKNKTVNVSEEGDEGFVRTVAALVDPQTGKRVPVGYERRGCMY